jgi:hypothetical protein
LLSGKSIHAIAGDIVSLIFNAQATNTEGAEQAIAQPVSDAQNTDEGVSA